MLLAIVSLWVPALVIVVTWGVWAEHLPSELPTHWGGSGPADAVTAAPVVFGWTFGVTLALALAGTILVLVPLRGPWVKRAISGTAGAAAAFVLGIWLGSAASSIGVTDPYTVTLGAWLLVVFVLPVYGLIPLLLLPKGASRPVDVRDAQPITPAPLAPGERVAWTRSLWSWLFIVTAAVMLVVVVVLWFPLFTSEGGAGSLGFAFVVSVVALLLVVALCAFRVTIDHRGLRVTSLVLGIPIKRIALADIEAVEAVELEPMSWGGWGYRVMPGRSAIILRRGPGLVLTRRDQKQFAITLDEPEEPAGILLGLMANEAAAPLQERG